MRSDRAVRAIAAVLLSFALLFAVSSLVSALISYDSSPLGILVSLIPYLFGFVAAGISLRLALPYTFDPSAEEERAVPDGADTEIPEPTEKSGAWLHMALALVMLLAVNFAIGALYGTSEAFSGARLAVSAAVGIAVKPLCEEILFRGAYLRVLSHRGGLPIWAAVSVQAVLFAAIHRGHGAVFALFAGFVLGVLAAKHSCLKSLAVHAAYNMILYAVMTVIS